MDSSFNKITNLQGEIRERIAFANKVVEAIKIVCGDDFPVMLNIRIDDKFIAATQSARSREKAWSDYNGIERVLEGVSELELAGFDAFNVDLTASSMKFESSNDYLLKRNLVLINKIKQQVSVPVILEAFKEQKELAKKVLHKGFVDAIGVEDSYLLRHDHPSAQDTVYDHYSKYWIA
ncbi:hypothetical protein [uncultured Draconibacterium sp.]|uniref:hypothetical protein n=1 Tax=uncultured Draconibacterium sp. TaxID=1573823 RepID=UPI0025CF9E8A|nr:hypothetical protein [uncultured Draconibacterium sp.]